MNRTLVTIFALLFFSIPAVQAKVAINEIMYSPVGDDDSLEWVELVNDGTSTVDVAAYKIDGNHFEDAVIPAGGYLIVARKLLGNVSFATEYGNHDGVWNGSDGYAAVDGQFELTNGGKTVTLTDGNGVVVDTVDYTSFASLADNNNKTIERTNTINTLFRQSPLGGTPGAINIAFNSAPSLVTSPDKTIIILGEDKTQPFNVNVTDAQNNAAIAWQVDGSLAGTSSSFTFTAAQHALGNHTVTVIVSDSEFTITKAWNLTVSSVPVSAALALTYNSSNGINRARDVVFSRGTSRIDFGAQEIDLSDVVDVDAGVRITADSVALDGSLFPQLTRNATITLAALVPNPFIVTSVSFTGTPATPCTTCIITGRSASTVTFTVPSFSQYKVVDYASVYSLTAPASVLISARKGEQSTQSIVLANAGTESLTNVRLALLPDGGYDVNITSAGVTGKQLGPYTLAAGESRTIVLSTFVPSGQDVRNVRLGTLHISANEIANKTIPLTVSLQSKLIFTDITARIDDESRRHLVDGSVLTKVHPGSMLSLGLELSNDYLRSENLDISDITLDAVIKGLEADGDDVDESAKIGSLLAGTSSRKTLLFTIPLDVEDKTYLLEIEATGVDEFNQQHIVKATISLSIEKDLHDLRIVKVDISRQESCAGNALVEVHFKNLGRNDEEDVRVEVTSRALGLDFAEDNLKLTDDASKDSEYLYSTSIDVHAELAPGDYPVTARIYRKDKLEHEQTVSLAVASCDEQTRLDVQEMDTERVDHIIVNQPFVKKMQVAPLIQGEPTVSSVSPMHIYALIGAIFFAFAVYVFAELLKKDHY
ncbi:lamin tail domain-containing protein [Candidatus Woesearchaeota archaeon]|nr:lamin tail domain-containing protein [Candidatus Woesearchaeota archaeon]